MPGCQEPAKGADDVAGEEECHLLPGLSELWVSLFSFTLTPGAPLGKPRISDLLSYLLSVLYTFFLLPPGGSGASPLPHLAAEASSGAPAKDSV